MAETHEYRTHVTWTGSTGRGYDAYDRTHRVVPDGAPEMLLSADPAFRGDPRIANPEQLLLAAASSCQMLSFLAIAANSGIDVVRYDDQAQARMPEDDRPVRITEIILRPVVGVRGPVDEARLRRIVAKAHETCYIANTLTAAMRIEPVFEII